MAGHGNLFEEQSDDHEHVLDQEDNSSELEEVDGQEIERRTAERDNYAGFPHTDMPERRGKRIVEPTDFSR